MRRKLLNTKELSPSCSYCKYGKRSPDRENVLCSLSGIRMPDSCCGKFIYDPLKRQPKRRPNLPVHSPDEFKL
ncbi:MAG: hypothetical protein K5756_07770 [Clostridiales bacterium]|nr:hypothetical protein [Clostridiales bacterium]